MTQLQGWATWDAPREPRRVLEPKGVERVRHCPCCVKDHIFTLSGDADDLSLYCTGCGYRYGDELTIDETLLLMDRYGLPEPLSESRVVT